MAAVLESHQRLSSNYAVVMVEGAGSPAEINLRANDIANMGFAEAVDCPVIIIADIDKKSEIEARLAGKTYESSSIFGLRPNVMLVMFVEQSLWDQFMSRNAPTPVKND